MILYASITRIVLLYSFEYGSSSLAFCSYFSHLRFAAYIPTLSERFHCKLKKISIILSIDTKSPEIVVCQIVFY